MDGRVTGFVAMRWFVLLAMLVLAQLTEGPADAATSCAREDFALTVDRAGAALRQLNADNAPRLRAKMRELKEARGWPDAGFEEKAYEILQDERMAALDMQANDLLAKLDALGTVDPSAEPDCAKLQELTATSLELQATVKAKAAYTFSKLDQMLGGPALRPEAKSKGADVQQSAPVLSAPKTAARPEGGNWAAKTGPSHEVAIAPLPAPRLGSAAGEVVDLLKLTADLVDIPSVSHHEGAVTDHLQAVLSPVPWLSVTRVGDNLVARTDLGRPSRLSCPLVMRMDPTSPARAAGLSCLISAAAPAT